MMPMMLSYFMNIDHVKVAKRVMWHLWRAIGYMLMYKKSEQLKIIKYFDSDAKADGNPHQAICTPM